MNTLWFWCTIAAATVGLRQVILRGGKATEDLFTTILLLPLPFLSSSLKSCHDSSTFRPGLPFTIQQIFNSKHSDSDSVMI